MTMTTDIIRQTLKEMRVAGQVDEYAYAVLDKAAQTAAGHLMSRLSYASGADTLKRMSQTLKSEAGGRIDFEKALELAFYIDLNLKNVTTGICPTCQGQKKVTCPRCKGVGCRARARGQTYDCDGSGVTICPTCLGHGAVDYGGLP